MRNWIIGLAVLLAPFSAEAASRAEVDTLLEVMGMSDLMEIMSAEGIDYGRSLDEEFLQGRGGDQWSNLVTRLHQSDAMMEVFSSEFARRFETVDAAPLIAFFQSPSGQEIITLEIAARRAMLDPDIETAAEQKFVQLEVRNGSRLKLLKDFAAANDLFENNVVGALNSNFAFFSGLLQVDGFDLGLSEDQLLADIWSQEDDIRETTRLWVMSFLNFAYQPLDDTVIESYTALSQSEAGSALSRTMFDSFDVLYRQINRELGQGAGEILTRQDI